MEQIIDTNYRSHIKLISLFIPLLSQDGKIINVGSTTGRLFLYNKEDPYWTKEDPTLEDRLIKQFHECLMAARFGKTIVDTLTNPRISFEKIEALLQEF